MSHELLWYINMTIWHYETLAPMCPVLPQVPQHPLFNWSFLILTHFCFLPSLQWWGVPLLCLIFITYICWDAYHLYLPHPAMITCSISIVDDTFLVFSYHIADIHHRSYATCACLITISWLHKPECVHSRFYKRELTIDQNPGWQEFLPHIEHLPSP